jgi:hypothetical protein
VKDLP